MMFINVPITIMNSNKYLGINLDAKLKWKEHVKLEELKLKYRQSCTGYLKRNSKQSIGFLSKYYESNVLRVFIPSSNI